VGNLDRSNWNIACDLRAHRRRDDSNNHDDDGDGDEDDDDDDDMGSTDGYG